MARRARPDTAMWRLPDGKLVRIWARDRDALRRDVLAYGRVYLVRPPDGEVYERIAPDSAEARQIDDASASSGRASM